MPRLSNESHERFARAYARRLERSDAAAALGINYASCSHVLMQPGVSARIKELSEAMLKVADITAERVMLELGRIAFRDTRKAFDECGQLLPMHELDDDIAAALAGIEHETRTERGATRKEMDLATGEMVDVTPRVEVRTAKVKFMGKDASLTTLAKRFKLIGDEGDGVNALASALADRLKTARTRVDEGELG